MNDVLNIFGSRIKSLEILALLNDLKPVVRQGFYDHELPKVMEFCQKHNLFSETSKFKVKVLDENKDFSDKGVRIDAKDATRGMRFLYISKDELKSNLANYFELIGDSLKLGLLLGYPKCCVDFFAQNEKKRSKLDNSYIEPALLQSSGHDFPFYNNVFQRGKDYALISHFPCSFNCKESVEIGKRNLALLKKMDANLADEFEQQLKPAVPFGKRHLIFA